MAAIRDWMTEAAEAIGGATENNRDVIAELCPFKEGVIYMPVPRCDQCRFWKQKPDVRPDGLCERTGLDLGTPALPTKARVSFSNVNRAGLLTDADFGCVQFEAK